MNAAKFLNKATSLLWLGYHLARKILYLETRETISSWAKLERLPTVRPSQFYDHLEAAIESRGISGVKISRITMAEGGMFSPKRKYLRIRFQNLVYDICGFPHGRGGFFISSRLSSVRILPLFAKYTFLCICLSILGLLLKLMFGTGGILAAGLLIISAGRSFRREASGASLHGFVDEIFSAVPLISHLYHSIVHPHTVYGEDLQSAFQQMVQKSLSHTIAEAAAPKASFKYEHATTKPLFRTQEELR